MYLIFNSKKLPDLCNYCFKKFRSTYDVYCINCKSKISFMERIENIKNYKKIYLDSNLLSIRNGKMYIEYYNLLITLTNYLNKVDILMEIFEELYISKISIQLNIIETIINKIIYILNKQPSSNFKLFTSNTNTFLLLYK
jgi:predicted amidophosphoribosyltransferase